METIESLPWAPMQPFFLTDEVTSYSKLYGCGCTVESVVTGESGGRQDAGLMKISHPELKGDLPPWRRVFGDC
jgi:hypothetical protein